MASFLASLPHSLLRNPNPNPLRRPSHRLPPPSLHFPPSSRRPRPRPHLSTSAAVPDEWGETPAPEPPSSSTPDPATNDDEWGKEPSPTAEITDEWGDKSPLEPEATSTIQADPVKDDDEWGKDAEGSEYLETNGSPPTEPAPAPAVNEKVGELKRCLVDTLYGTDLGLRTSVEVRGEILELVSQLEAENPTPAPTESPELLDGNWILLYTAFSELLPLLAAGSTPLLKIKQISQEIDSKNLTIVNATTLSSPLATLSFSATASFEVRSPSRIQVQFKEGAFQPPKISPTVNLPPNIDIFGQKIDLSPVQQSLGPVQDIVANISRTISGQPPLKIAIPGNRGPPSWLLTTYLDGDFRISRGDGGLFVLAKEGSPLLEQQ